MELDTIVIGSGAGGLSAAICLARAGQQVLVLEQHNVPGGWCHSFYLDGHRFTPGVHYIGLMGKGESTSELYEGLGIANDLVFFRMNAAAYEHCWLGDQRIDMPAGLETLYAALSERFPAEKKGLAKYLQTVRDVSRELQLIPTMNGLWDNLSIPWRTRHLGKYALFSLQTVIAWHIKDPLLRRVLNVQCGDHGLPPAHASFPLHCAVMDHYFNGGFYPMGGGAAIVKAMTRALKKHGGEIRTGQSVKCILLAGGKNKQAIGVELDNGEKIYAKNVVSNADPAKTYTELVGAASCSKRLLKKLAGAKYSCTSLMLFLTVDMDLRKAGIDSGNIWLMPNRDMDELYPEMMKTDIAEGEEFPGVFISCTTLKDPSSFDGRHHTIEAITYMNYAAFSRFKDEGNQHSAEYAAFKTRLAQKIINSLEKVVPGISSKIVQQSLGTPMTNEWYIRSTNGCVYGTEKSFLQTGPFAFKAGSEIKNLYLCGASILSHGVAGAGYSGVQTAAKMLGCTQADLIKPDASQNVRVYDAENAAGYPDWLLKKMNMKKNRQKTPV